MILGDLDVPLKVSKFIKDVHSGFQLLNLKNDGLRRKSDGLKYSVCIRLTANPGPVDVYIQTWS